MKKSGLSLKTILVLIGCVLVGVWQRDLIWPYVEKAINFVKGLIGK